MVLFQTIFGIHLLGKDGRLNKTMPELQMPRCQPDSTFRDDDDYSNWDLSGLFQINLRFGSLSFTQAKVVDVAWDVVSTWLKACT